MKPDMVLVAKIPAKGLIRRARSRLHDTTALSLVVGFLVAGTERPSIVTHARSRYVVLLVKSKH